MSVQEEDLQHSTHCFKCFVYININKPSNNPMRCVLPFSPFPGGDWHREVRDLIQDHTALQRLKHCSRYRMCVCVLSRLTLCDPMDCSLPGSSVHGMFQVRILEWVAISSSRECSRPRARTLVSWSPVLAGSSLPKFPPGKTRCQIQVV